MIDDDEFALLELAPIECVEQRRKELYNLLTTMVGSLYPTILMKDLDKLDEIIKRKRPPSTFKRIKSPLEYRKPGIY